MRFLHTSDWHLGKSLKGRSRSEEHQAALAEILDIARREKIDCLLITGDLFDSQAPPPEAEQLAFNFFSELRGLNVPAVVIGGNHDHPKRLLAIRDVLNLLDIHIRPEPVRPADGGIVRIESKGQTAQIAVLPFVTVGKISDAAMLMGPEVERFQAYSERIAAMMGVLAESFTGKTINLMMAHLYVDGADTCKSERDVHVTKPYAVQGQRFPSNAHYIALGHLHRPQEIPAPSRTFYAGSLLQLDFGEQDQRKRVVVIDAHPRKPAKIDSIEISAGRNLRDVTGTLAQLTAEAAEYGDDLLRVTVMADRPIPGVADSIRELLPNALEVRPGWSSPAQAEAPEISGTDPFDLFCRYYSKQTGSQPADQVAKLFRELYEEAVNASD